ncbi:hypothetical protein F2P79_002143 [Pimephales promelas]|nr:hypothetical protein F2P79_002143 [Pimephales promelas]
MKEIAGRSHYTTFCPKFASFEVHALTIVNQGRKTHSRATYSLPMNDVSQCDWIISKGYRARRRNGKWPL